MLKAKLLEKKAIIPGMKLHGDLVRGKEMLKSRASAHYRYSRGLMSTTSGQEQPPEFCPVMIRIHL